MLQLGAEDAQISVLCLRSFELRLGLGNIFVRSDAGLEAHPGQIERLAVSGHGGFEQPFEIVLGAKREIIDSECRGRSQPGVLQIGGSGLRFRSIGVDRISDTAPEIKLPGSIQRQRVLCYRWSSPRRQISLANHRSSTGAGNRGRGSQGGEQLGPSLLDQRAGGEETRQSRGNILIGNIYLLFQSIQMRIADHPPPIPAKRAIPWLSDLPAIGAGRFDFLVSRRSLDGGFAIFGSETASAQQCKAREQSRMVYAYHDSRTACAGTLTGL